MTLEQRGIVLLPVPFSDLSSVKRRPVLVLSSYEYNSTSSDVVVAAITSNPSSGHYGIRITSDKLYTLRPAIILTRFGRGNESVIKVILSEIDKIYGKEPIPNSA